jgi:hypothetical protein
MAYYAKLAGSDQSRITVGYRTTYEGNYGLFNIQTVQNLKYQPADYENEKGFWAYFIYPTAMAESKGSFFCLNTYDKARFTFGFMQFGAHVPNGDFVVFFKKLLTLPDAKDYFPRVRLFQDHIYYFGDNGVSSQLEDDTSTDKLMNYLNPSLSEIEHQEHICSARMVHWAMYDPEHRKVQVETAIENFKKNMIDYNLRFNLSNAPAKVCQIICDIRHQGRGKNDEIALALNTNGNWDKAYSNLLGINYFKYRSRIDTIRNTITNLTSQEVFNKVYDSSSNSFH